MDACFAQKEVLVAVGVREIFFECCKGVAANVRQISGDGAHSNGIALIKSVATIIAAPHPIRYTETQNVPTAAIFVYLNGFSAFLLRTEWRMARIAYAIAVAMPRPRFNP